MTRRTHLLALCRLRLTWLVIAAALPFGAAGQTSDSAPASAPATTRAARPPKPPVADDVASARRWIEKPAKQIELPAYAPALQVRLLVFEEPRPQRVWIVRVDTSAKGVAFSLTEPKPQRGDDGKNYETACETTLAFARRTGASLAVNTSAFGPLRSREGEPMDLTGLAAREGAIFSKPARGFGAMYVSREGRIRLSGPPLDSKVVWNVIPGFRMLIDDKKVAVEQSEYESNFGGANPRTAVGADRDGSTLWIVVADGRQPGYAVGLTLAELAAVFQAIGAWDALNLDGGGSTTLVIRCADGEHRVLNRPIHGGVPGALRQVGNNLGVMAPGEPPDAASIPK